MSKQTNPALIGVFVLGAIGLLLGGIVVFGSGKFFKEKDEYIMYFTGSVSGLKVGAPVTFRGVQIGEVSAIRLLMDQEKKEATIPVVVQFDKDRVGLLGPHIYSVDEFFNELIERGLRAQLQSQSFVTGLLAINLDFYPDTPAHFVKAVPGYKEVPTVASKLEELSKSLESLPIRDLMSSLQRGLDALAKIMDNDDARSFFATLNQSIEQGTNVLHRVEGKIDPVTQSVIDAAKATQLASQEAQGIFRDAGTLVSDQSETRYDLADLIKNLSQAARAVRDLADYLQRNPNSVVYGKRTAAEGKQ